MIKKSERNFYQHNLSFLKEMKLKPFVLDFSNLQKVETDKLIVQSEMNKCYKSQQKAQQLIDYEHNKSNINNLSKNKLLEDEDILKLINMICGAYVEDDFNCYLSYNYFLQKKDEFDILHDLYQRVAKKYKNKRIEESKIKFRSLLLMVFIDENMNKMTRGKIEEIFKTNKMVW